MKALPATIWSVPAYLPHVHPDLDLAAVRHAGSVLGHSLPPALLNILAVQNGGGIRFRLPDDEIPHASIHGIGTGYPSLLEQDWTDVRDHASFELDGLVPFDGDGHWHLCLDWRYGRAEPAVSFVDIELDRERLVANSFDDYLAMLVPDFDDELVVEPGTRVPDFLRGLEQKLKLRFEAMGEDHYGYPVHRAGRKGKEGPEWIWISPNLVPRGFVRKDHPRHDHHRGRMGGMACRHPPAGEAAWLLSATPGLRPALVEACAAVGVAVRPLQDAYRES